MKTKRVSDDRLPYHSIFQLVQALAGDPLCPPEGSRSVVSHSLQPHGCQASLSYMIWSLLQLASIESVIPSTISSSTRWFPSRPLLLPSIFPSIRVFSNESVLCIRWPKYGSFSFRISPFNGYSGLISFRTDCFASSCHPKDAQSLLQHHGSKATLQHLAFLMV